DGGLLLFMGQNVSIYRGLVLGMTLTVTALTVHTSSTPAQAEQLIALGQEKVSTQSTDSRTSIRTPLSMKDSQTTVRKSHKLIRKSSPSGTAVIQAPNTTSGATVSNSATPADGTTLQSSTNTVSSPTSTTFAPVKASSTATSSLSLSGAISSGTTAPSTTSTPLAGVAAPGGNGNGNGNSGSNAKGGRGMQGLATAMPGLSQLITPTTSTTSPSSSTPSIGRNPSLISFSAVQNGANPSSQ